MIAEPPTRRCKRGHREWVQHSRGYFRCRACKRMQDRQRRGRTRRARALAERKLMVRGNFPEGYLHHPQRRIALKAGYIHNDGLRVLVLAAMRRDPELTFSELAERCGWYNPGGKTDSIRVTRGIGITPFRDRKLVAKLAYRQLVSEDDAVMIARAIHMDPWEIGL